MKHMRAAVLLLILSYTIPFALAHVEDISPNAEEGFMVAMAGKKASCDAMSNEEITQMGTALMDRMMGTTPHEELERELDEEAAEKMHYNMGKMMGCGNAGMTMMAQEQMGPMMQMMYGSGMMGSGIGFFSAYTFFGLIVWLLVVAALVLLIMWLVKQVQKR